MQKFITYMQQLQELANTNQVNLREAFRKAGIQDSTYHRINTGEFNLRESTARTVWEYICEQKYKTIQKEL
tara:strand:+ start:813 stop:1025 length:213 start_codon:yes stop_codon:yes gene_type:complete